MLMCCVKFNSIFALHSSNCRCYIVPLVDSCDFSVEVLNNFFFLISCVRQFFSPFTSKFNLISYAQRHTGQRKKSVKSAQKNDHHSTPHLTIGVGLLSLCYVSLSSLFCLNKASLRQQWKKRISHFLLNAHFVRASVSRHFKCVSLW